MPAAFQDRALQRSEGQQNGRIEEEVQQVLSAGLLGVWYSPISKEGCMSWTEGIKNDNQLQTVVWLVILLTPSRFWTCENGSMDIRFLFRIKYIFGAF